MIHLNQAHVASGGKGVVELGQLVSQFGTPAWAPLKNSQSDLVKFLTTTLAKGDGIDYQSLVIMGLLHCADSSMPLEKADALYELLQEGGAAKHDFISSGDKDMEPVFRKLFSMATYLAADGAGLPHLYSSEDRMQLDPTVFNQLTGTEDEENSILDTIFGVQSKVKYEVFKEKIIKEGKWIFKATELRKKIHGLNNNMPMKHIQKD